MKKLYSTALTCTLLILAGSLCHAAETAAPPAPAATTSQAAQLTEKYTNTEKNYTITYPSTWKKTDVPRLDLVLFAPPKASDESTHASMNVVSEKVGPGISLEQFYSESAANLASALKDVVVEKNGNKDLNGVPTKWIQYTHVMQNIKFRVLQYFIVAQDTVFLLTFSTVADSFDSYREEFDAIANSFVLGKAPIAAK